MTPIRALLFDLDDTLLDEQTASHRGFEALVAGFPDAVPSGPTPEALARWRVVSGTHWRKFERGEWTFQEQRRARVRDFLGLPMDDREADLAWAVYGAAYEAAWTLVPGCLEFLHQVDGLSRVLVTNGERDHQRYKLQRTGLAVHFPLVVTPADAGAWKPDLSMFRHAWGLLDLAIAGLRPEEVLMVGDDPVRDIEPARALGFQTWRVVSGDPDQGLTACSARLKSDRDGVCFQASNPA